MTIINSYFLILISGFLGGVIRGLIGFIKHQYSYKNVPFDIKYFFLMSFLSGIIGLTTAGALYYSDLISIFSFTPPIALISGYAGGDLLENIYKIIIKKPKYFPGLKEEDKKK
ncbi:MAG: hypothetical protein ACP5H7_00140 [Minisyncoccia bacterium]